MRLEVFFDRHPVFTHAEFLAVHGLRGASARTANNLLAYHVRAGHLVRVRRGLYVSVPRGADPESHVPNPYLVATRLADDAVVAYHSALEFHGYAYSVWWRVQCLAPRRSRPLRFRGLDFVPLLAPDPLRQLPNLGGGVLEQAHGGGTVRVTTVERTFVDVLHAPRRGGGWEEIWRSLESIEFFNLDAVLDYVATLGSATTAARVGYFLEQHRDHFMVGDDHLAALRALSPAHPRYFDARRVPGKLSKMWNLIVPYSVVEKDWEEPLDIDG